MSTLRRVGVLHKWCHAIIEGVLWVELLSLPIFEAMAATYLLLGGNIGDRHAVLRAALTSIEAQVGKVDERSAIYETAPWGFEHPNAFLNQVVLVTTVLQPMELLHTLQAIETALGRTRVAAEGYAARIIDIDILFYNNEIVKTEALTIPHPLLHHRLFTLEPLAEIAPQLVHPVLQQTIAQLLETCKTSQPES